GLDNLYASLDDIPGSLDDVIYQGGQPFMAAFDLNHKMGYFTGPPLQGVIETGEAALGRDRMARVNAVEPILEGCANVQIGYRDTKQAAVEWTVESEINGYGLCEFDVEARYHRARILPTGTWDKLQGIEFDASIRGRA